MRKFIPRSKPAFGDEIKYYCKDCAKFVNAKKIGRKFVFSCPICKTKNVAFGTEKSLKNFFHIEDDEPEIKEEKKVEEKAKTDK